MMGNGGRQRKEAKVALFVTMFFQPCSPLCEEVDLTNKAFDYGVRIVQIMKWNVKVLESTIFIYEMMAR